MRYLILAVEEPFSNILEESAAAFMDATRGKRTNRVCLNGDSLDEVFTALGYNTTATERATQAEARLSAMEESAVHTGCPCLYVEPCSSNCSCLHPGLSGGCSRCARYGSLAQRKAAAARLASTEARLANALEAIRLVLQEPSWYSSVGRYPLSTATIYALERVVKEGNEAMGK